MASLNTHLICAAGLALLASACAKPADGPAVGAPVAEAAPENIAPPVSATNAVLAGCAPATGEGYCGVTFGMTPQQVKDVFPATLIRYSGDVDQLHDSDLCFEMLADAPVEGVSFLVENNQVGRVDVIAPGPVTSDGFGVGSTVDEIRATYGTSLLEGPNKYEPDIIELTVPQGAGKVLFEIQDGAVRAWRAGVPPLVDYVERCG